MDLTVFSDSHFMKQALIQAEMAAESNEIPIGAIIVCENKIIAKAHNQVEKLQDVTAHAEMLAITSAQNHLGAKYLDQCTLYVTLEPCIMCGGALYWSQIGKIVIGARDEKRGYSRISPSPLHPKTTIEFGVMENESESMIKSFFKKMRRKD
jgi:tRNA(adenine34) deaminase